MLPEGLLAGMHGCFAENNSASVWEIFIASPPEKVFIPDEVNDRKKCEKKTRFFRYLFGYCLNNVFSLLHACLLICINFAFKPLSPYCVWKE